MLRLALRNVSRNRNRSLLAAASMTICDTVMNVFIALGTGVTSR